MQIVVLILAILATVAAPYALVTAMPRLSQAALAALAIAVPIGLGFRHVKAPPLDPRGWLDAMDGVLVAAALVSLAVALFARAVAAAIGERARCFGATLAINVLGIALIVGTLPWMAGLAARFPIW